MIELLGDFLYCAWKSFRLSSQLLTIQELEIDFAQRSRQTFLPTQVDPNDEERREGGALFQGSHTSKVVRPSKRFVTNLRGLKCSKPCLLGQPQHRRGSRTPLRRSS